MLCRAVNGRMTLSQPDSLKALIHSHRTLDGTWEEHGRMLLFVCSKWNKLSALCPQRSGAFVRDNGGKYGGNTWGNNMGNMEKTQKIISMNQYWLQKETICTSNAQHENSYPSPCVQSFTTSTAHNLNNYNIHKLLFTMSTNICYSLSHGHIFD